MIIANTKKTTIILRTPEFLLNITFETHMGVSLNDGIPKSPQNDHF